MHKDQYALVFNRRLGFDQRVWQVPSLAVAVQALVLSSALNANASRILGIGLCVASIILSLCTLQLMAKLRHLELEDAERLRRFEVKQRGYAVLHGRYAQVPGIQRGWHIRLRSYHLWLIVLWLFLVAASAAIFVQAGGVGLACRLWATLSN